MKRPRSLTYAPRPLRFEAVEERLVLSAQPLPTLVHHVGLVQEVSPPISFDGQLERALDEKELTLAPNLSAAHGATGVDDVHADYGFYGGGQTVVVIDSGIDYNHQSLGGGWGNRVVGGWDFAENDADPYDDAPAGFHGTHVAGIIGSDHASNAGVASQVDLVALRVFDDFGNGSFAWVEQALQWVIANQDTFANPITTVNMSLGVPEMNSGDIPNWAMLEDELEALYNAGIFVSVSAGNDFELFNTQGLSYPAVSPWAVAVSSANDAGTQMSDFSQRADRVLVAPGESIVSTVPDELFSFNGVHNDWASASGTSMASPYVAGASVLVREAYAFMGIDAHPQAIYDVLFDTASLIYDSVTDASYHFIDVEAALASIITDAYGNTSGAATNMGTLGDGDWFNEWIGTLSDSDYFTFTAAQTGTMTLSANVTQDMVAQWNLVGGGGSVNGNLLSFDVVAGQTYTVGLSSSGGMGHYNVDVELDSNFTDWGVIERTHVDDILVDGEAWYSITATRTGLLTVEANYAGAENVTLEIYDDAQQLLAGSTNTSGHARSDATAAAGQTLLVRVTGDAAAADFSLWNIVGISGSTATVFGDESDDVFSFAAGADHAISVNGLDYTLDGATITRVDFLGRGGADHVEMTGTTGDERAYLYETTARLVGDSFMAFASEIESTILNGNGGDDTARLEDGASDDLLNAAPGAVNFAGAAFDHTLNDFGRVRVYAETGGHDTAYFEDSSSDDVFYAWPTHAYMQGGGFRNWGRGFEEVHATALAGTNDRAFLYDAASDDILISTPTSVQLTGDAFAYTASGFDRTRTYANAGGSDSAFYFGSAGDDDFFVYTQSQFMRGGGYYNYGRGFEHIDADASQGGYDRAVIYNVPAAETLTGSGSTAALAGVRDIAFASFDRLSATSAGNQTPTADIDAVDYLYFLLGSWNEV